MENLIDDIICGNFRFYNNFDSANLERVEQVKEIENHETDGYDSDVKSYKSLNSQDADYEFNLWTKHDCHGTQYQNNNRTWFYFGIQAPSSGLSVKLNIVNLNKQVKMFSQGMCPVFKIVPGHMHWERIRQKPTYTMDHKNNDFTLSFIYYTPENSKSITYFAFTYPFSYTDLQTYLNKLDMKLSKKTQTSLDDIYYHRECAIKSLDGRRLDILTISSYHNISMEREDRLKSMFPEKEEERSFKFQDKKIIFISARVHPGETPSSFVLNGFLNLLVNREDPFAIHLRRQYVFKLVPMLNPDGVARGHYRMDTRGINLNRVYLNPSEKDHPTIYAAWSLIRYYHNLYKISDDTKYKIELTSTVSSQNKDYSKKVTQTTSRDSTTGLLQQVNHMTLEESEINPECILLLNKLKDKVEEEEGKQSCNKKKEVTENYTRDTNFSVDIGKEQSVQKSEDSGLFLYIDMHGHASKKGVFMYGNHFENPEDIITCMLLPKLMSLNNSNFHFTSCNFTEKNMYLIDKRDGMSREGSGRVAVYKLTGLVRSYTLECNYNSGRLVNTLPPKVRENVTKTLNNMFVPPKYTPSVYEAVGAALGPSILDLTNSNPNSRLPNSQYRTLRGVRSYLKLTYVNNVSASLSKAPYKDGNVTVSKDLFAIQEQEPKVNIESTSSEKHSVVKGETNLVKKACIVRRTTSLYTAVKKIKGNKKTRQTTARKMFKSQRLKSCTEENCGTSAIKSERRVKNSAKADQCSKSTTCNFSARPFTKYSGAIKKINTATNTLETNMNTEDTAVLKQGAKRLKIISHGIVDTQGGIGEPSSSSEKPTSAKANVKINFSCNKQSSKGTTFAKPKKHTSPSHDQGKLKKSGKLRDKTKHVSMRPNFNRPEAGSKN
ncbi:cytosolic carboxypeptidase-like protein 5 [Prorops nasuta]|uniref:cytosolic carboxypeptidase-like protein 5 n=1 Tax=Prorops nasuta TaxID=863751 RepID=UPI0034CE1378